MISSFKKFTAIVLTFVFVFTSLPVHFTDLGGVTHVYAEENIPDIPFDGGLSTRMDSISVTEAVYSDDEIVELDAAWLTADLVLKGNDYEQREYDGAIYYYNIISKLNLPEEGENGSIITWSSSNETVIEVDGTVHRPTYSLGDEDVILTATLTKGGVNTEKSFYIGVSSIEPTPDESAVMADYEWLVGETVIHYGVYADDIRSNVNLPTKGDNGSDITWYSSDERWIETDGTVTQPPFSFAMGSAAVTLTATIAKGDVTADKTFPLEVYPLHPTAEDHVAFAKEKLTDELVLFGNSADNVKTRLFLPKETGNYYWFWRDIRIGDCQISWQSSDSEVIDVDGWVYRPAKGQENVSVTLTATISYGEAYDTKTFDFVVTAVEEFPLAINYYNFNDITRLQFNGVSATILTKDRDGKDITALQFNNAREDSENAGGSVFTKNKIRLDEDLSFSTAFSYSNPHPNFTLGEGGFVFTLQAVDNTVYSPQLYDKGIKPSISIAFISDYYKGSGPGQSDSYGYRETAAVYYNGDYENRKEAYLTSDATNAPATYNNVWIEYDGVTELLELRFSTDGLRPTASKLKIENLNLAEVLMSADDGLGIEDVRELYAGFMGSMGNGKDKSEIESWYFKNDSVPINFESYSFVDLSNVILTANPPSGEASSTITAFVSSLDENPMEGILVDFTTSFGTLETSSETTNASGNASVILRSGTSGTACVKAVVPGGATALTEVQLAVSDEDRFNFDYGWLTKEVILGENTLPDSITDKLNLHETAPNGSTISWESNAPEVIATDGTVTRPSFSEENKMVQLTATITKGDYSNTRVFNVTVQALDSTDAEALSITDAWLTYERVLGDNLHANQVEKPLSLALTGPENTIINWSCTHEGFISLERDTMGQVTQPSFSIGDVPVTLVATIVRGDKSLKKTFEVIVKAPPLTDEEAVALDYNRIKIGDTLGLNPSPYAVTENLTFSTASLYGSEITYQSNALDVLTLQANGEESITGLVKRPGYEDSHRSVTVTVTITKGSHQKVKKFEYTVLALRDTAPPVPVSIVPANNSIDVAYNTKETLIKFNEDIIHPDGTNFYGYLPKHLNITLNGSPMSDDYIVRYTGTDLIITNRAGFMPTGKNEIFIPASAVRDKTGNFMAEDLNIVYTVEERVVRNIGIASSVPTDGMANVPTNAEISVTFDTSGLKKGSSFNGIALMNEQYPNIPIVCELKDNKVTVSFKYAGWSLQKGKIYWLLIPGGAVEDRFLNQNQTQLLSFIVSPETVKPTIISNFPKQNETDVSVLQHIQINYKDAVTRSTGQIRITDEAGRSVEFAIGEMRNFDTTVDLVPLKPFQPNTRYAVHISSDFVKTKIAPQEPANSDYTFSFTTGDDKLSIQSMTPKNFAEDVSVNEPIRLVFNRPVQRGPNYYLLKMIDSAGNDVGIYTQYNGNMAEIKPLSLWLDPFETYTLIIPAGVFSDAGGNLNDSITLTFTTGKKLDLSKGDSFSVDPSNRYLVGKKITFDTKGLQETFRMIARKLVSCEWDFGDGQTASGLQADHVYTRVDNYTVKLKAIDNKGIEYELTQPMSVRSLERDEVEIIVTPEKLQNLIREDEYIDPLDGLPGRRLYSVYVKYEGMYLSDEKVNVYLYKNGKQKKDFGTVTTTNYKSGEVPVGYFPFDYKNPSYIGNYELVFVYGDNTVQRTVKITDQRAKQDLRIQPVNTLTGEVVDIYQILNFEVDGVKHSALRKQGENALESYYVIENLPTGFHKIKLIKDEWVGHSSEVMDFWHTSTEEIAILPMQAYNPGISQVWAELITSSGTTEISSNMKDYKTFINIPGILSEPPIRFNIDVDWDGVSPGYFEIQYNGWIEKTLDPWFDFVPSDLYPDSKLLVRAVNPMGDASPWVDCKIAVIEAPDNVYLTYVDGEYQAEYDVGFSENKAGQIEGLNNMPLMDHDESFGVGGYYDVTYGKIKESNGRLLLDMSYNVGGSYGKTKKKPKMVSVGYDIEAEHNGRVYLIYNPDVGNWSMETGEFGFWGDVSVWREKGKVIPIIELGAKGKITIGTGLGGTIYIDNSPDAENRYSGIITLKPYATGEIYGGIKGFNVEGYVGGSVETQIHIPTGYIQVVPELSSKITKTMCFVEDTVFDKTYTTSWNNGKEQVKPPKRLGFLALPPDLDEEDASYQVIPRNYILQDTERAVPVFYLLTLDADTTIKNNIYPYADVELVKRGDELVAVWVDDNHERTDLNRSQLFTSTKTGSAWSSPESLYDDGTADFAPTATVTDTEMLMAWQDFDGVFTERDAIDVLFKKAEISVTGKVYGQSDESGFASLTKDDYYDHSPVIASLGKDSALTVWIKSGSYEVSQGAEGTDRLMYSVWNGSSWGSGLTLQENMPLVSDCSLIAGDDNYLLLYTYDSDNDITTPEDNEIWARIFNISSSSWGEPIRLTDNNVLDSNAQGVFHNGDWFIIYNQDDRYVYRQGLTGETLATESLAGVSGKTMLAQGDDFLALVYQEGGENNNRSIAALFYDLEKGIWSNEISLTSQPGYVRSFSPIFDSEGNLCLLYTHADIITEVKGETEYYVPSNNVNLMFSTYTPKHDLSMDENTGITLSNSNLIQETTVNVTCLVENKGDFAEMVVVALYEGTPENSVKIGEVFLEQPIPARESIPVTIEWIVPAEERIEYNLYAVVESAGDIVETDTDNNISSLTVFTSDIELTDVQWESLAGYQYLVKPLIFNNGSTSLENIQVTLEHDQTKVASTVIEKLEPGEFANTSFAISSEDFKTGSTGGYPMVVTVSLPKEIIENSTENNVLNFELDTRIVLVDAMNPANGQQKVGVNEPITLIFNRLIEERETFNDIKLTDKYLNPVPVTKTIEQNVLTITPENSLQNSTQYTLTIPKDAIGDSYGHSMRNSESLSFTTVSQNPAPIFSFPFDQAVNVGIDSQIRIQYSETIKEGSTFNDIYFVQYTNNIKIPVIVTIDAQWLIIKPARSLAGNTGYSVHIPRGAVKNINEDHQSLDYNFTFTTKIDPDKPVDKPVEKPKPGSGAKPPASGELSLSSVLVDSQYLNGLNMSQDGFYILDLSKEANILDGVRVTLSTSVLEQILQAGAGIRVVTEKGELTFPEQWIRNLTENEKQSIIITIAKRNENNQDVPDDSYSVSALLNITVTVGGRELTEFETHVTVVMPVRREDIQSGQRVIAYRYDELIGRWLPLGGRVDLDAGTITFRTSHFSDFAAFETVRSFHDVTATWAKEPVEILASRGLINGKGEGLFDPVSNITRAEFTAIVIRSLYVKPVTKKGTFSDVAFDVWYAENVETAVALGIINGVGNGRFAPLDNMTREQLAVIAYRLIDRMSEQKSQEITDYGFIDQRDIASYATEGVNYLASKGIMIGSFDKFNPKAFVTRQEAAVVLYRLLKYLGEL